MTNPISSELDKILDDFAEEMKEIQAERINDVYYDRNSANHDVDTAYEEAKQAITTYINQNYMPKEKPETREERRKRD